MNVYLKDYLPNDAALVPASALAAAVNALGDGDTLFLGGGRLEIGPEGALRKYYYISNNDHGEKPVAFPLIGKRNVTVDGEGADIVFHGSILPFAIDHSANVTVKNLSIDYRFPQYGQGLVVEADRMHTVLEFDGEDFFCRLEDGVPCFYSEADGWAHRRDSLFCLEFDAQTRAPSDHLPAYFAYSGPACDHGFLGSMFRDVTFRQLGENRIGMYGDLGFVHTPGNCVAMMHATREYPGIFVTGSDGVTLERVRLYHTLAMGVICQLSSDITLDRMEADVREGSGRLISVNADATHFVNCRGRITLRGCRFVKMNDDAANLHGIYVKDVRRSGTHGFTAGYGHPQQVGINIFRPGDRVRFFDYETTRVLADCTVADSVQQSADTLSVTLREPMPDFGDSPVVAENVSTAPEITITGCESGANRPRGFLVSSAGRILIENCLLHNMNQGVNIGGEMLDWYESGATTDVTIRNNEFRNSAYAGGAAICAAAHVRHPELNPRFHGRVLIEHNRFTMNGKRFLDAQNVGELIFRENTYTRDPSLPDHGQLGENGVCVKDCGDTSIEPVREA